MAEKFGQKSKNHTQIAAMLSHSGSIGPNQPLFLTSTYNYVGCNSNVTLFDVC